MVNFANDSMKNLIYISKASFDLKSTVGPVNMNEFLKYLAKTKLCSVLKTLTFFLTLKSNLWYFYFITFVH